MIIVISFYNTLIKGWNLCSRTLGKHLAQSEPFEPL